MDVDRLKQSDIPDRESENHKAQVIVLVNAEETGPVEFSLSYVVSSAQWKPMYDIRASVSDASKSASSISCHYRASISQSTGEDWGNTRLTLSTASPQVGTSIPTLKAHHLGEPLPPVRPASLFGAPARSYLQAPGAAPSLFGQQQQAPMPPQPEVERSAPPPPFMATVQASASQGAFSATFGIDGLSSIPSDEDGDAQTHKVTIANLAFNDVTIEWIAIPRELPSVFFQVGFMNISPSALLT